MTRHLHGDTTISGLAGSAGLTFARPRALRTLLLLALTAVLGAGLLGPLAPASAMPLTSVADATLWFDDASPTSVAMEVLRLVALGISGYLTLALVLTLAVDLLDRACRGSGRHHPALARLLPALLRRFVMGTAQVGLVAVTAIPAAAGPADSPPATATVTKLGDSQPAPSPTATMTRLDPPPPATRPPITGTATMTHLGTAPSTSTTSTTIAPETAPTSLAPVPIPPEAPAPAAPSDQETWVVSAGDTFWSIAEEALVDHRGGPAPQNELVRYWRQLIAANQRQLAAPGNPDLLLPGQSLVLPSPR